MVTYDLNKAREAAIAASDASSRLLLDRFRSADKPLDTWMKAPGALVTDADMSADGAIAQALASSGLPISIRSEESTSTLGDGDACWLVDPLCGTVPFSLGMPHWGVNIALLIDGRLELGLISIPTSGERLVATGQGGARLGQSPLESAPPTTELSLSTVGLEVDGGAEWARVLSGELRWVPQVGQVNTFSSAAYPAAQVCMGRLAAAVFYKIAPVHIAAGACIATELGLRVTDSLGRDLDWNSTADLPIVVMGWPEVHGQLIDAMDSAPKRTP
ncbi:MAG: inositol monophosphatase [Dehalococcoidia bacterium]|nr:inositol monophosphatase [Dehalococcoidia bacterium]